MFDCDITVVRNDELDFSIPLEYDFIVLSPGPGLPTEAGVMMQLIREQLGKTPILGVCLGMQGVAEVLGASIYNQKTVKHGLQELITTEKSVLFSTGEQINVGLYHSWAVKPEGGKFDVTAYNDSGVVMAIENPDLKVYGVQFHPESIMTPEGKKMIGNFLES